MNDDMLTLFGSSDDEEEIESTCSIHSNGLIQCVSSMADACVLHLTRHWLSHNRSVLFSQRFVAQQDRMESDSSIQRTFSNALSNRLEAKGIHPQREQSTHSIFDAAVVYKSFHHFSNSSTTNTCEDLTLKSFRKSLIHGGILILNIHHVYDTEQMNRTEETRTREMVQLTEAVWDIEHAQTLMETTFHDTSLKQYHYFTSVVIMKRSCTINTRACPWKLSHSKQMIPVSLIQQMQTVTQKGSPLSSTCSSQSILTMLQYERYILEQATITPSVKEILSHGPCSAAALSVENIQRAVMALQTYGFTIVRNLFHPSMIEPWTRSALQDFESAHCILKKRYQVDLLHPGLDSVDSKSHSYREPLSYKELAMREDYRVDLRDGPFLQVCRNDCQTFDMSVSSHSASTTSTGQSSIVPAQCKGSYDSLRFHPDVLDIVRHVFNPKDENTYTPPLYKGNYGRWNFEGAGPDGTPQPLRIGQVGSIISLPGAADQAIHADTPHLFEHMDLLPCHYANLFIVAHDDPSCCVDEDGNPTGDSNVGGTAFIHGTHSLSVCAKLTTDTSNEDTMDVHKNPSHRSAAAMNLAARDELYARIVRPSLQKGDALLFDCRILHFGLANSSDIRRPLLYVNMTQSFFIDPKNWDDKTPLFDSTRME